MLTGSTQHALMNCHIEVLLRHDPVPVRQNVPDPFVIDYVDAVGQDRPDHRRAVPLRRVPHGLLAVGTREPPPHRRRGEQSRDARLVRVVVHVHEDAPELRGERPASVGVHDALSHLARRMS